MPPRRPSLNQPQSDASSDPLLERVRARVARAARAIERRDRAGQAPSRLTQVGTESASCELRALRMVYHGLSRLHRRHREQTGQRVAPALKAAAQAFKREPTVLSLTPVAGHLDEMGLLTW